MTAATLPSRHLIRIGGKDAGEFLHSLITTDVDSLPQGEARPGALLTPQGKILFDFILWRDGEGFLMETDAAQRDGLIRRLTMYKLRAAVEISAAGEGVTLFWGEDSDKGAVTDAAFSKAGVTLTRSPDGAADAGEDAYRALRVASGIVASGEDFALQDAFPHDVLLDRIDGLSFRKGCYVGQEVVSRMQHRGTARRRVTLVEADQDLPATGTEITAGGKPVGALGSVSGGSGLAIVRIDRVADAVANGVPLLVGEIPVRITLPAWSGLEFPSVSQEVEP